MTDTIHLPIHRDRVRDWIRAAWGIGSGLLIVLAIAGCGGGGPDEGEGQAESPFAFDVGPPLSDPSHAIVVRSEYGTDTLQTEVYRRKLRMLRREQSQQAGPQGQEGPSADTTALHRRLVDQFVTRRVLARAARTRGVEIDSARLEEEMQKVRKRYENEVALQAALRERDLTVDSARGQEANTLRIQQLKEQWTAEVGMPSEPDIQEYRDDPQNQKLQVRHIALRVDEEAPPDTTDSVRARARAVLDSIQEGASFAEMARRYSDAPNAPMGGMMRAATPERMGDRFADAILALQETGDVTEEPIRTDDGFHLFQLVDQASPTRGQAKWQLFSERRQQAIREKRRALMEQTTVRINPKVVEMNLSRIGETVQPAD